MKLLLLLSACFWLAAGVLAQQPATEEGRSRFVTIDLFIDSGTSPLAAYQLDFRTTNGTVRIVGIEGGDHQAFREAPTYDPKAMQANHAIIANFSTMTATNLPSGRFRVASLHLQIIGDQSPGYALKLQVAADPQGRKIPSQATLSERKRS